MLTYSSVYLSLLTIIAFTRAIEDPVALEKEPTRNIFYIGAPSFRVHEPPTPKTPSVAKPTLIMLHAYIARQGEFLLDERALLYHRYSCIERGHNKRSSRTGIDIIKLSNTAGMSRGIVH